MSPDINLIHNLLQAIMLIPFLHLLNQYIFKKISEKHDFFSANLMNKLFYYHLIFAGIYYTYAFFNPSDSKRYFRVPGKEGKTWDGPHKPNIMGFEPDRMMELPDGRLAVCSHIMLRESQEFAEIMTTSTDGGKTWGDQVIVAHDGYHRFCEGALVILDKEIACVMRENHSGGIPSFVTFSQDNGQTWSDPQMCPFALHRPYVKQLNDGRCMANLALRKRRPGVLPLDRRLEKRGGNLRNRGSPKKIQRNIKKRRTYR